MQVWQEPYCLLGGAARIDQSSLYCSDTSLETPIYASCFQSFDTLIIFVAHLQIQSQHLKNKKHYWVEWDKSYNRVSDFIAQLRKASEHGRPGPLTQFLILLVLMNFVLKNHCVKYISYDEYALETMPLCSLLKIILIYWVALSYFCLLSPSKEMGFKRYHSVQNFLLASLGPAPVSVPTVVNPNFRCSNLGCVYTCT